MRCEACGMENAGGTRSCVSCGRPLDGRAATISVRVSRVALVSSVCTLIGIGCFIPSFITYLDPRVLHPRAPIVDLTEWIILLATAGAFLLGIAGLLEIATHGGRLTGYPFALFGAAAPFFFTLGSILIPTLGHFKALGFDMVCGTNLSGIGKAMLIYANDYDDELPVAGGPGTTWAPRLNNWAAADRSEAFGLDPNDAGGQATVSSSLWLLVKYGNVPPEKFICKGERGTRPFNPSAHATADKTLSALWDFGPDPMRHCSYSYHLPYGTRGLTVASEPGFAVTADHSPWIDGPAWKVSDFAMFKPSGTVQEQKAGNAIAHSLDGQNVMFLDTHVDFQKRSTCGLDGDNIYTSWDGQDKARGVPPKLGSVPADKLDSLLVNDPVVRPR
jgi:hypothetical protein